MKKDDNISKSLNSLLAAAGIFLTAGTSSANFSLENTKQPENDSIISSLYWEIEAENGTGFTPDNSCSKSNSGCC